MNEAWGRALRAAELVAVDPHGLGGVWVRAAPGPVRQAWCDHLRTALPDSSPQRRLPGHTSDDRLLGGLDLVATLRDGAPRLQEGLLTEAHQGLVWVPMAERLRTATVAHLCAALDAGELRLERDGMARVLPARIAVVALDEGIEEEGLPAPLADRLGPWICLDGLRPLELELDESPQDRRHRIWTARRRRVAVGDDVVPALCAAAMALGVDSLRLTHRALAAARAQAALEGRDEVDAEDLSLAVQLVLAPRATRWPAEEEAAAPPEPPAPDDPSPEAPSPDAPPASDPPDPADEEPAPSPAHGPLEDRLVAAARAALPPGLLAGLQVQRLARSAASTDGTAGAMRSTTGRGRRVGTRPGDPRRDGRLDVLETLRAAAPWQRLRGASGRRLKIRPGDFRVARTQRQTETLTIFAVDASGSSALQRMAEAKGAVEQVLADCYVRRDHVALIAFRGDAAELLMPPTRSLVRAKRCLAGLPGGGTTPLAAGLVAAQTLALDARRRGQSPVVVVMTDGRGNVALDGTRERTRAETDALRVAEQLAMAAIPSLFVDTAPRPQPAAQRLAQAMNAQYVALPRADARIISERVQAVG